MLEVIHGMEKKKIDKYNEGCVLIILVKGPRKVSFMR